MSQSHTQGPVPLEAEAYVEREFEQAVQRNLLARKWVLLLGPRQHGKTSALFRIRKNLAEAGFRCAFVDLQRRPPCYSYSELLEWVAERVASELGNEEYNPPPRFPREITSWLELAIPSGREPVVILVDEASSIPQDEWRNSFFGQIRAISSDRAAASEDNIARRLLFVFSGTFRPETLVDERNSPFNICERVDSEDLTVEQARYLASTIIEEEGDRFAEMAYAVVGGQPYLLQGIFGDVARALPSDREDALEAAIARLKAGEDDHFTGIFSDVIAEKELTAIVRRMVQEGFVPNEPANANFKFLQVIGLATRDKARLVFRNPLYQQLAQASPQIRPEVAVEVKAHLFALPDSAFNFIVDDQLREIVRAAHRGAITCYSSGSYRLSLAGFGCALEGMLLDWLKQQTANDRSTAIRRSRANFVGRQNANDPDTWDLVNLMKVAREIRGTGRRVDPSEALRHWRNEIHPAVAIQNYISEERLEPEARAASGLFDAVRRDIQPP
jgi:hypothetical protein